MPNGEMGRPTADAAPTAAAIEVADRHSRNASLTLAFAQPGDTLLYLLLPLHHESSASAWPKRGCCWQPIGWCGSPAMAGSLAFTQSAGRYTACLLAALGSLLSTLGYATLSGVWALLIARLMWGLSFAAMNIATQALATAEPTGAADAAAGCARSSPPVP